MSATTREFVDTNILVYAYDQSPTVAMRRARARSLIERLWENQSGCLSTQVLQEFYNVATRKIGNPLTSGQAYEVVQDFISWNVHSPVAADVLSAIRIHENHHIAFWDALIIQSAVVSRCSVVWSEDLNDGQEIEGVLIANPFRT